MSHVFNPTPVPLSSITEPDDGDLASAASITLPLEDVANGVKNAQDGIDGTTPGILVPQDINVGAGSFIADSTQVTIGVPLVCPATSLFSQTVVVTADLTVSGVGNVLDVGGGALVADTASVECWQPFTSGEIAHFLKGYTERTLTLNDADQTVTVADADVFFVPLITAARSYLVSVAGASEGQKVKFTAMANTSAFPATVITPTPESWQMANHSPIAGTSQSTSLELRFRSGAWKLESRVPWF